MPPLQVTEQGPYPFCTHAVGHVCVLHALLDAGLLAAGQELSGTVTAGETPVLAHEIVAVDWPEPQSFVHVDHAPVCHV